MATLEEVQEARAKIARIKEKAAAKNIPIEKVKQAINITLQQTGVTGKEIMELGATQETEQLVAGPQDMPGGDSSRGTLPPQSTEPGSVSQEEKMGFGMGGMTGGFAPQSVSTEEDVAGGRRHPEGTRLANEILLTTAPTLATGGLAAIPIAAVGGITASLLSENVDPTPGGAKEVAKRALATGAAAGAGEGIGMGLFKSGKYAGEKFIKSVTGARTPKILKTIDGDRIIDKGVDLDDVQETQKIVTLNETGETLTIDEAFDTPVATALKTVSVSNPVVGARLSAKKASAAGRVRSQIENIIQGFRKFGTEGADELFARFKDASEEGAKTFRESFEGRAKEIDELVQPEMVPQEIVVRPVSKLGVGGNAVEDAFEQSIRTTTDVIPKGVYDDAKMVDLAPVREEAKRLLAEIGDEVKNASTANLLKDIIRRADKVPFVSAQRLRSSLLGVSRTPRGDLVAGRALGISKKLSGAIDKQMEKKALDIGGEELLGKWRAFNDDWRKGKEFWNDTFLRSLVRTDPTLFTQRLSRVSADGIKKVKKVLKTSNDEELVDKVVGATAVEMLSKSINDSGEVVGKKLFNLINDKGSSGITPKALELLGPDKANNLKKLGTALKILSIEKKPGAYGMMARFAQFGAATGVMSGNLMFQIPGAVVLATPVALGRYISNPKRVNKLIEAAKLIQKGEYGKGRSMLDHAVTSMIRAGMMKGDSVEDIQAQMGGIELPPGPGIQ